MQKTEVVVEISRCLDDRAFEGEQVRDAAEQGGLSRSVFPNDAVDPAGLEGGGDALQHALRSEALVQVFEFEHGQDSLDNVVWSWSSTPGRWIASIGSARW